MTPRVPRDRALNRLIDAEVEGTTPNERLIFVDTDNQIREVVFPSAFATGDHLVVRERLEKLGVLKAVVHISATVFGTPSGHGPRTSVVEYLPDGKYYATTYQPAISIRASKDDWQAAMQKTKKLFGNGGGEERKSKF